MYTNFNTSCKAIRFFHNDYIAKMIRLLEIKLRECGCVITSNMLEEYPLDKKSILFAEIAHELNIQMYYILNPFARIHKNLMPNYYDNELLWGLSETNLSDIIEGQKQCNRYINAKNARLGIFPNTSWNELTNIDYVKLYDDEMYQAITTKLSYFGIDIDDYYRNKLIANKLQQYDMEIDLITERDLITFELCEKQNKSITIKLITNVLNKTKKTNTDEKIVAIADKWIKIFDKKEPNKIINMRRSEDENRLWYILEIQKEYILSQLKSRITFNSESIINEII